MKANPKLLSLLRSGARVTFSDQSFVEGSNISLEQGFKGEINRSYALDKDGLKDALLQCEEDFAEDKGDDFSDISKSGYGILIMTDTECAKEGISRKRSWKTYNVVNEGGDWLEGDDTRVGIRRKYLKRLAKC